MSLKILFVVALLVFIGCSSSDHFVNETMNLSIGDPVAGVIKIPKDVKDSVVAIPAIAEDTVIDKPVVQESSSDKATAEKALDDTVVQLKVLKQGMFDFKAEHGDQDSAYIKMKNIYAASQDLYKQAQKDYEIGNYDSAVTHAISAMSLASSEV